MSKLLSAIKQELVKKQVPITEKINVDEETHNALSFFKSQGINTSDIIQEALKTWRRRGVISLANDIKKELEGVSKNSKKEEVKEDE